MMVKKKNFFSHRTNSTESKNRKEEKKTTTTSTRPRWMERGQIACISNKVCSHPFAVKFHSTQKNFSVHRNELERQRENDIFFRLFSIKKLKKIRQTIPFAIESQLPKEEKRKDWFRFIWMQRIQCWYAFDLMLHLLFLVVRLYLRFKIRFLFVQRKKEEEFKEKKLEYCARWA